MKKNELPDWAKKYDGKGITFRKKGDSFLLVRVSSHREKGKSYPVVDQTYLGTVTERDGFTPSNERANSSDTLIECGLSHFVMSNFHDDLQRSVFNSDAEKAKTKIAAAIVLFLYGDITGRTVRLTSATVGMEDTVLMIWPSSKVSVEKLAKRIGTLFAERFHDDAHDLICMLRQEMCDPRGVGFRGYTDEVQEMLKKYGGDFR